MTGEEQRLMRQLGSDEYADIMKQASDDIMKKLKSGAKAGTKATSIPRKLSNPIINIFAYTAPALVYGYTKITEALEDKAGETITQKNRRLWALSLSYFTQQQKDKILKAIDNATPEQAKQILDIVDYSNLGTEAQKAYDNIVSGGKAGVDLELEAKKLEKKMQENNEKWLKTLNLEGTIQVSDTLIKN
jgi:O-methyltransferase involved in polyketide biosynthesis